MRFRGKAVAEAETPAKPSGDFLLVKPPAKHQSCDTPSFTPWSDSKDKFGPGTIWQCAECHRFYLVKGTDPLAEGFWKRISAHSAQKLLNRAKRSAQ